MLSVILLLVSMSLVQSSHIVVLIDSNEESYSMWQNLSIFRNQATPVNISLHDVHEDDILTTIQFLCRNFNPGESIILDLTHSCSISDVAASSFTPYLRATYTGCHCDHASNIQPQHDAIISASFEYVTRQNTTIANIIIIADICQYAESILDETTLTIPIFVVNPRTTNISTWLIKMSRDTIRHYTIIIGTAEQINTVLCLSQSIGKPNTFNWILHVLDNPDYLNLSCLPSQYVLIQSAMNHRYYNTEYQTEAVAKLPNIANDVWPLLMSILPKLKHTSHHTENICRGHVSSLFNLLPITEMIELHYNVSIVTHLFDTSTSRTVGTWSKTKGFESTEEFPQSNSDLVVVTLHEPPFVFIEETENGTTYRGYAIDVFSEISSRLSLTYTMYTVSDGQYGRKYTNGSWSGLVGEIVKGAADIALAPLSVTTERDGYIDFTSPFYDFAGIQILMKKPNLGTSFMAFTFVYSKTMWTCWFLVLVITAVLIYVFERTSPYSPRNSRGIFYSILNRREKEFSVVESFWFVIASVSARGPECTPRTLSTRILIAGFWLFCTIMMANYIANLAAVLTTTRLTVPIESLTDLAKQTQVKYSLIAGTTTQDYFDRMATVEKNFYDLWRNMSYSREASDIVSLAVFDYPLSGRFQTIKAAIDNTGLLKNSQEGLEKVLTENFAMIHESPMLQYELSRDCKLMSVGKQFSTKYYAIALKQHSVLTKLISKTILDMQSGVVFDTLKEKWWQGDNSSHVCVNVDESQGLTFSTTGGIFLVAVFGLILGFVVLIAELSWFNIRSRGKTKEHSLTEQNSRTNLADDFDSIHSSQYTHQYSIESCNL